MTRRAYPCVNGTSVSLRCFAASATWLCASWMPGLWSADALASMRKNWWSPSKTESWRCENKAFVRDFTQKNESWRCENEARTVSAYAGPVRPWSAPSRARPGPMRGRPSIHLPRHVFWCKTKHFANPLTFQNAFRARPSSKTESWRCGNEAFLRDFLRKLNVEDVKTKLSCKASLKNWKLKIWKRSFHAAFLRDFPQKLRIEGVNTMLSC